MTQYEYSESTTGTYSVYGVYWYCQTFTVGTVGPNETHYITSVALRVYKTLSPPGNVIVSIKATSGGLPTGDDLCSCTMLATDLPTSSTPATEFVLTPATVSLQPDTMYCICFRCPDGTSTDRANIRGAADTNPYAGGCLVRSYDGGSSFSAISLSELVFWEYGQTPSSYANWYNVSWTRRRPITLLGSNILGNQTNFPVYFLISGIGNTSKTDGTDIIFTTSGAGSTRLHHDMTHFHDYSGGAWIQMPELTASTDQKFYMYWGNLSGGDQTDIEGYRPSSTWDESYVFVCHMQDGGNDGTVSQSYQLTDSTRFQTRCYKRIKSSPVHPIMVKSLFGSSQKWYQCNGTGEYNSWISSSSDQPHYQEQFQQFSGQIWIEAIVSGTKEENFGTSETYHLIAGLHTKPLDSLYGSWELITQADNRVRWRGSAQTYSGHWYSSMPNESGWAGSGTVYKTSLVCLHYKSGNGTANYGDQYWRLYIEGTALNTSYLASWPFKINNTSKGVIIGQPVNSDYSFSGCIQEVRILNQVKNYNWQLLEYYNISCLSSKIKADNFFLKGTIHVQEGASTTSFNTIVGTAEKWSWGTATFDSDYVPRSTTGDGTKWEWSMVTGDSNIYIPSGNELKWSWCKEDV